MYYNLNMESKNKICSSCRNSTKILYFVDKHVLCGYCLTCNFNSNKKDLELIYR